MSPNQIEDSFHHYKEVSDDKLIKDNLQNEGRTQKQYLFTQQSPVWINIIAISALHIVSVITFLLLTPKTKILTVIWVIIVTIFAGFGVTAGAHRLWTHRSYKAKLPLQILLLGCYATAGMNSLFDWVRDHRIHHKFSETDADPHNSHRGFFFSHVGWLFQKKHPEVYRKGKTIDMSDITNDPLLAFYNKYFMLFRAVFCFIIPPLVPMYLWNEDWLISFCSQVLVRYTIVLNCTWSVNSFAHIWGYRPFDKRIMPAQNIGVSIFALGEGWHNYHHVFPYDYRAAEIGAKCNPTTSILDYLAKYGLAYDFKTPSKELVQTYIDNYGDGTESSQEHSDKRTEEVTFVHPHQT